jgi:hypothetical protein
LDYIVYKICLTFLWINTLSWRKIMQKSSSVWRRLRIRIARILYTNPELCIGAAAVLINIMESVEDISMMWRVRISKCYNMLVCYIIHTKKCKALHWHSTSIKIWGKNVMRSQNIITILIFWHEFKKILASSTDRVMMWYRTTKSL